MHHSVSWGRFPNRSQHIQTLSRFSETRLDHDSILPLGLGRSYGDVCLNTEGSLLATRFLNRFLDFDSSTGILRCEAGLSFKDLLRVFVPRGWFPPVTPGTCFVTLGGAVANDVHGKNHHRDGTFGKHVHALELTRSDGRSFVCSPSENRDLFTATIGGLGLTGTISQVSFKMIPIRSPMILAEAIRFGNLDDFYELSQSSKDGFRYTVAWIDCLADGSNLGRGVFFRGNHDENPTPTATAIPEPRISIPIDFPGWALNTPFMKLFNFLYRKTAAHPLKAVPYPAFFYPLDQIGHWNRMYGKRGFLQFQCTVPFSNREAIAEILKRTAARGKGSFLAVLKTFGNDPSPGLLSFPQPGPTLALDFPVRDQTSFDLYQELAEITVQANGRLYPAKDACMTRTQFETGYPNLKTFLKYVDPNHASDLARRLIFP